MKEVEKINVLNLSGSEIDPANWTKGNKLLAVQTANWLGRQLNNCVAISTTDDGALLIDYAMNGQLQPTIRIYDGKVIWPRGTNFDLMMSFLTQE